MSRSQERTLDVLSALQAAEKPLSLTELSKNAGIAASTAHSIMSALVDRRVATIDRDKRYALGPELFHLGASYVRKSPLYRAAWRDLISLAHTAGVSAALATPGADHHLVIAVHDEPDAAVRLSLGSRVPLDAGSYGKVYFAQTGAAVPETLTHFTDATLGDRDGYLAEVAEVRRRGYGSDLGEYVPEVFAVAAPVTSADGYEGLAALMARGPVMEGYGVERAGSALASLCARASALLGDASREPTWGESL
jgi:DNA-binding IclR family transcriptional regulator